MHKNCGIAQYRFFAALRKADAHVITQTCTGKAEAYLVCNRVINAPSMAFTYKVYYMVLLRNAS